MSLATFKKKSVIIYGTTISGKKEGFSLNGRYRNKGGVGQSSLMSNAGTPMYGKYAMGHGGTYGRYKTAIIYNVNAASDVGSTLINSAPSVLTTVGMLQKRYTCIYNGTYPTNVVKNIYTGNLTDNKSQGVYIRNIESANVCLTDVNNPAEKNSINGAVDQSTYILDVTKKCNQVDLNNNHIPIATNGNNSCIYGLCG